MNKIPFHIVSGFLGSGKTTFLKRVIENYAGKCKLGVIQNEFAHSNTDGVELKQLKKEFQLLEINKGSVFCVCLMGDFIRSLEKFIDKFHPEMLVIETSGLSDTTSIAEVLSTGSLGEKVFLSSNWCIVDAVNFSKSGLMKQRVMHQIRMADMVLLNKIDLGDGDSSRLTEEIRSINPFAEIKPTTFCEVDFDPEFGQVPKFYPDLGKPLSRPDVHSMVIKSGRKLTQESLVLFLNEWAPKAYRIKGYVNFKNGKTLAVQCVFDLIKFSEISGTIHPTELVAITDQFTLRDWNHSFRKLAG